MERIVSSVILVIFMMASGYFLAYKKILNHESNQLFSKMIMDLSLPSLIILGLTERFTREGLIFSAGWLGVSFGILVVLIIITRLTAFSKLIKRKENFELSSIFANTIFIGVPVNIALFGNDSITYIFLYYLASTTFFWTYGMWCLRGGGNIKDGLKNLINPATIAFIVAIFMIILNLEIPEFLKGYMRYMGGLTTPLAMLYLGTAIHLIGFRSLKPDMEDIISLVFRFMVAPIVAFIVIRVAEGFIILPILLKKVFLMQASMPIMTNMAIMSGYYNKNPLEASKIVGLSTVCVIVTIPFYAFLVEFIF